MKANIENAMHKNGESVPWLYLTYLSMKELRHNLWSTFKISLVVAFIVLPLILLASLGGNFLDYVKDDMERRFDLRKIRAIVGNPSRDSIKPEDLSVLIGREDISFVQPISTRGVQIIMQDDSMEEFDAVATSKADPTLKRIGFPGPFPEQGDWLILHENFAKDVFINPETNEVSLVVSSISERGHSKQYIIPFKIAGTYRRGGGREIYLPLELMDRFGNWRRGYAVPEWKLPGREDQEAALGLIYYTDVRVFPPYKITQREIRNLSLAEYNYAPIPREWNVDTETPVPDQLRKPDHAQTKEAGAPEKTVPYEEDVDSTAPGKKKTAVEGNGASSPSHNSQGTKKTGEHKSDEVYRTSKSISALRVSRDDKRVMTEHDLQTIKDVLIRAGTAIVVPEPSETHVTVDGEPLRISASTERDPWKSGLLIKGSWLGREKDKVQVVLPANAHLEPGGPFPFEIRIRAGGQEIPVQVQGFCRGPSAYAHPRSVYRLAQVAEGKAVFDSRTRRFGPVRKEREYVAVYIYAARTDQVNQLENYLQKEHNYVTESYGEMIEDIQITEKRIRILIILLAIAGFFAVILSITGTMGEAVRRKRRLIGLMRAMGVLRKGVAYFFLFQALSYGILGIFLACASQVLVTWVLLERSWLYEMLKTDPSQHLFWPSMTVWGIFALATILICGIAGVRPAVNATKFEPGEILSSAE